MTENEKFELELMKLMETELYEQARKLDDARSMISRLHTVIFRHLIEVLLIHDEAYDHHIDEINTWLRDCQNYGKIKLPSRDRLTTDEYYDLLFGDSWEDLSDDDIKFEILSVISDYYKTRTLEDEKVLKYASLDFLSFYNKVRHIYRQISEDLHKRRFLNVRNYIE